jgi:ABC-type multidrug transport system fused ATPase/permease subunit
MGCFEFLELNCPPLSVVDGETFGYQPTVLTQGYGSCVTLEATYPCDAQDSGTVGGCKVKGHTTIETLNQYSTDKFESLFYLFCIGLVLRAVNMLFRYYPPDMLVNSLYSVRSTAANSRAKAMSLTDFFAPGTEVTFSSINSEQKGGSTPAVLAFRNVQVRIAKKLLTKPKTILDNVSGVVTGGRLCALMGPSGSGKTTLLNALSGRALYAEVEGRISLDGHELSKRQFA